MAAVLPGGGGRPVGGFVCVVSTVQAIVLSASRLPVTAVGWRSPVASGWSVFRTSADPAWPESFDGAEGLRSVLTLAWGFARPACEWSTSGTLAELRFGCCLSLVFVLFVFCEFCRFCVLYRFFLFSVFLCEIADVFFVICRGQNKMGGCGDFQKKGQIRRGGKSAV